MKSVAKLIAYTPGVANCFVYISMGMTIYPIVDSTVCYIVAKLHCKCPVYWTSFEFLCHKLIRWHMMCGDNNMLGFAGINTALYEFPSCFMFLVESLSGKPELSVADSVEICYASFRLIFLVRRNLRPKCRGYQVNIINEGNYTIIDSLDIRANVKLPAFMKVIDVETLVEFVISGNHYGLAEVLCTPIPKRMAVIVFITEITDVTGKHKYVADRE